MESNSRTPVLEMNRKEKKMFHQKKWAFSWVLKFCRVSDDRIVAGSRFHDAGPVTANARLPKLVFKHGTWRWPCCLIFLTLPWKTHSGVLSAGACCCVPVLMIEFSAVFILLPCNSPQHAERWASAIISLSKLKPTKNDNETISEITINQMTLNTSHRNSAGLKP